MSIRIAFETSESSTLHFKKCDLPNLSPDIAEAQFPISQVQGVLSQPDVRQLLGRIEAEIDTEGINRNSNIYHGVRHIKNVVLFSFLTGSGEGIGTAGLSILLQAAKYHDMSREQVGEGKLPHAEESAAMALPRLSQLPPVEAAAIQTAIAFHEVPRGKGEEDSAFIILAMKYGVPNKDLDKTRAIGEILKDADALDRTRFGGKGRTNVKLLKTKTARQLVKFASAMQEQFALEDIAAHGSNADVEYLLQSLTPQEALFRLREAGCR